MNEAKREKILNCMRVDYWVGIVISCIVSVIAAVSDQYQQLDLYAHFNDPADSVNIFWNKMILWSGIINTLL